MIYFFDSYETLNTDEAKDLLPAERYEKFNRLKHKRDKENCLAAYLLLKYALEQENIDSFTIKTGENGKPYLDECNYHFNISHCKYGVAVAVSPCPIGIDVQEITEYHPSIAKRVFSEEEVAFMNNDSREFTRLWTLKEAAAKYDGRGISALKDFTFENCGTHFTKYGSYFSTFERKNLFVSVCGSEDFSDIIDIKIWRYNNENLVSGRQHNRCRTQP